LGLVEGAAEIPLIATAAQYQIEGVSIALATQTSLQ